MAVVGFGVIGIVIPVNCEVNGFGLMCGERVMVCV